MALLLATLLVAFRRPVLAQEQMIRPDRCTILVVGNATAIRAGDPTGARPEKLTDFGEVVPME